MSAAIGLGIVSIPYIVYQSGVIIAPIMLCIGGYVCYWSEIILMKAAFKTNKNNYGQLVKAVLGTKARRLLDVIFIFATFMVTTIYLISFQAFLPEILIRFGISSVVATNKARIITIISCTVLMLPIFLKRNLSMIANLSFVGILAVAYVIILIIV
jgi:amino acid permease